MDDPPAPAELPRLVDGGLLERRLVRAEIRRAVLAALFLAVAGLIVGLYIVRPGDTGTRGIVVALAIAACFVVAGAWLIGLVATSGRRRRRLLETLAHEPSRLARIYGAVLIRGARAAVLRPIPFPEEEHMPPLRTGFHVVVELAEPNRVRRLLGLHKHAVPVRRQELVPLLAYLRGLAPSAAAAP